MGAPEVFSLIDVRQMSPRLGAEVRGISLAEGVGADQFAELKRAFLAHQVLVFKEQTEMAPQVQVAFGKMFGDLHEHPAAPTHPEHPEIFVIHTHRDSKIANGNDWHTDVSCDLEPPSATMLQLHLLPPSGGDTLFSSMYAAYDKLSDPMKAFLATLSAHHESEHVYRGRYSDRGVDDSGRKYPSSTHPVIRTHPETGRQSLFVNGAFTTRIEGLSAGESRALLAYLLEQVRDPGIQIRQRWERNDVVLWDNRCVQHYALWDYWPHERKGHRVTIRGDRPFYRNA